MTDQELILEEIAKIEKYVAEGKSTGRTYKIANDIICKFWDEPMESDIIITDHDGNDSLKLAMLVKHRIESDFPGTKFRLYKLANNWHIVRTSQSFKENAAEHIAAWKKRLSELQ